MLSRAEITPDDLESQVEFYYKAGYDAVPITVSMMAFGKVTEESPISKVIQEKMLKDEADRQDAAGS